LRPPDGFLRAKGATPSMKIAFRVDSSAEIGSGHLVRCVTLADYLKRQGHATHFICRNHPGHLDNLFSKKGHLVHMLDAPAAADRAACENGLYASWLGVPQDQDARDTIRVLHRESSPWTFMVMDHYGLDIAWQRRVRPHARHLFVIDDLANRSHDCDVLLDQNLHAAGAARYQGLVPDGCILLCGPQYALLRSEFQTARARLRKRDGRIRRVLVFFGGVDKSGETIKACAALSSLHRPDIAVDVVVGMGNPHADRVKQLCEQGGFNFLHQVDNMAELMAAADLAVGAGGTTTFERAYLGLPAIIAWVADNQQPGSEAMDQAGAAWNLGRAVEVSAERLTREVVRLIANPDIVRAVGERAYRLSGDDPATGVERVAKVMRSIVSAEA